MTLVLSIMLGHIKTLDCGEDVFYDKMIKCSQVKATDIILGQEKSHHSKAIIKVMVH